MKKYQIGVSLLEVLVSITISAIIMLAGAEIMSKKSDDVLALGTANYQTMLINATRRYLQANFTAIAASTTSTSPIKVTFNQLLTAGYVPSAYSSASINPYGQTPCVLILQPSANKLSALVVTEGGMNIPNARLYYIASQVGIGTGFLTSGVPYVPKSANKSAIVSSSANYVTLNCSGTTTGYNHLFSLVTVDSSNLLQDYVYRNAIPNQTAANTMSQPLIMGAVKTSGSSCTSVGAGAVAQDGAGKLLSCGGSPLVWGSVASSAKYWKDPMANIAALNAITCSSSNVGETHVVLTPTIGTTARAYTCTTGSVWHPWNEDDNGDYTEYNMPYGDQPVYIGKLKVTKLVTEFASCSGSDGGKMAQDSATGAILTCIFAFGGNNYWRRDGNTFWQQPIGASNLFQYWYSLDLTTYPVGMVVTDENSQKMFMSTYDPARNDREFVPIAKGPLLNGASTRVNQINDEVCSGSSCQAIALCSMGTTPVSGYCSGTPVDAGAVYGTTGYTCTGKAVSTAKVRTIVFCQ